MNTAKLMSTVMVLGLLTGWSATSNAHDMTGKPGDHQPGGHCESALPKDKAALVHNAMQKAFTENKALFAQMHELHKTTQSILTAPKFDKQAYLANAAKIDALQDKMRNNMQQAIADVAGQLTPAERGTLAASWQHHGDHQDGDHHDGDHHWDHHGDNKGGDGHHHWNHGQDHHEAALNQGNPHSTYVHDDNGGSPRHDE